MTPRELIRNMTAVFRQAGVPDPETDAALLLSHLTGRPVMDLRLDFNTELSADILAQYEHLCAERSERIPLQHLTGTQYFHGHLYRVCGDVLIPRPETAELVEHLITELRCVSSPSVLDLCCGSGCIGIELSLACPEASVTCSDLSVKALRIASENAACLGAIVRFVQGDLFSSVSDERFDLIVSNPPYIPSEECDRLQPEVMHEPRLALDGGTDGLDFYRRIILEASSRLNSCGILAFEIGFGEEEAICAMLSENGFQNIRVLPDLAGIPRMIIAR